MADPASIRLFTADLVRSIDAYKRHLIPKRKSLLRVAIPIVSRGLGSFFGGPVGGKVAGGIATALSATGRFPRYVSPYLDALRKQRARSAAEIDFLQAQLRPFLPQIFNPKTGITQVRLPRFQTIAGLK